MSLAARPHEERPAVERPSITIAQKDALDEARELLQEPSRNTKRKILLAVNVILGLLFTSHVAIQLATSGRLPDPERDNILMPIIIFVNLGSAAYNFACLFRQQEGSPRWNALTQWSTVLILWVVCLSIVHRNPNTATSLLSDQTLAILTIFLTGVILNRYAALGWFFVNLVSVYFALKHRGVTFEYYLMTSTEIARLKELANVDQAAYGARVAEAVREKLVPLPAALFAVVSIFFSLLAMLATFFEAGMIGQVLKAMPTALDKIQIASREKQRLEEENVRMGAELDVAQRIQAMILPLESELAKCKGLEVAAKMTAASEVGGDLYDVLPQPDGSTVLVIGDVTDHGLASGLVMLMSQSALRVCLEEANADLQKSLAYVNATLYKNVQTRMKDARTLTLALLHHKDGQVRLAGQHESVILLRKGSEGAEEIETMDLGCVVGMIDDIEPMVSETQFEVQDGDIFLLYTDGATEAENPAHDQYGVERLKKSLVAGRDLPSKKLVDHLFADIMKWIGSAPVYDDITLLLVRKRG
jgi:serine phosphatase RsbU (regulator of sigma subunit)